jgi:CTD small phosphatase-like protein 2
VKAPYLPERSDKSSYTLVLDLDETLVHYKENPEDNDGHLLLIRPGVAEFLDEMCSYYEVVIFTAAMQDYADWVLDQIDPGKRIEHRLY